MDKIIVMLDSLAEWLTKIKMIFKHANKIQLHIVCSQVQIQSLVNILSSMALAFLYFFFLLKFFFFFFYNFCYILVLHVHGMFNFSKLIFNTDDQT